MEDHVKLITLRLLVDLNTFKNRDKKKEESFFKYIYSMSMKLTISFLLIFFTSILNSQSLESGLSSWERGHYSTAIRAWIEIAKAGNASAENNIGYAYEKGLGARQDYLEALKDIKMPLN